MLSEASQGQKQKLLNTFVLLTLDHVITCLWMPSLTPSHSSDKITLIFINLEAGFAAGVLRAALSEH